MKRHVNLLIIPLVAGGLLSAGIVASAAPPAPQPVTLPCA